jgi:ketosteroid isomerase-like protein
METIMANMTSTQQRNQAAVLDRFAAWANGTGNPFELLAEDAIWTITGRSAASKTYVGREAFLHEVIRPFNARMQAPLKPTVHNIYADGDAVVIFFDANAVARDGKPYANTYTWYFDMRDGKVVKATAMFDSIEFNDLWNRVQPSQ